MNKKYRTFYLIALETFIAFFAFTIAVLCIDYNASGPQGSLIGFSKFNLSIFNGIGVSKPMYYVSEILGYLSLLTMGCFFVLAVIQLIKRKSLFEVDRDLIALGIFYAILLVFYLFFDFVVVNYRPIVVNGELDPSYPSSHTMLSICVMVSAVIQIRKRIENKTWKIALQIVCYTVMIGTIFFRFMSGYHWFTDYVGGFLLSASLLFFYGALATHMQFIKEKKEALDALMQKKKTSQKEPEKEEPEIKEEPAPEEIAEDAKETGTNE